MWQIQYKKCILICYNKTYSNVPFPIIIIATRQSEMANTSPRHMPVLGNVHPIKIEKFDIFRDVISLLARVFILLIYTVTQEVPMKNIWKKLLVQFLSYIVTC